MVIKIIGKSNTGKSLYYEKIISQYNNRIYFGTLKETESTKYIIERHQLRRDSLWVFGSSEGNIYRDMEGIENLILLSSKPVYCMIDGLTNWCVHCTKQGLNIKNMARYLSIELARLLNKYDFVFWYLLDNTHSDYSNNYEISCAWEIMHNNLDNKIKDIKNVLWEGKNENHMDR